MSKRLSTCTADRLNRCFQSTSTCIESPYLETTENSYLYFTRGVVKSRDLTCPITVCQANCNHRRMYGKLCHFTTRNWWKIPYLFQKLFHPAQKQGKKSEFCDADFFGFNSKNELDYIIKNTKVFYYVQRLVDVAATARSNDAKCSVAFLENKRRKISWEDNWFQRLLFVCLFVYDCQESASWARRANWLD